MLAVIITGLTVAAHFRGYTYIVPLLGDVAGVASVSVLVVGLQGWVLELAPEQSDTASALYVAMFNLGIGTGAMAGGAVLQMAGERPVRRVHGDTTTLRDRRAMLPKCRCQCSQCRAGALVRQRRMEHDLRRGKRRKPKPLADIHRPGGCDPIRQRSHRQSGRHGSVDGGRTTSQEHFGPPDAGSVERLGGDVADTAGWSQRCEA